MRKKFYKKLLCVVEFGVLLVVSSSVLSQDLPRIIQPSPETSALFRFQNYPMDYSTGLPQINIPIYEIKSGDLSVPISLSYHASGRRVYDQDGPIAVGWSLNAGGMISRTVYGAVDFGTSTKGTYKFPYPFNTTNISNRNDFVYLERLSHFDKNSDDALPGTWMDGEYDIFSYSFNNASGKFFFKDDNDLKTAEILPYKPFIITPHSDGFGLNSIDILDDKGILYQFMGDEWYISGESNVIDGYVLTKMISADKTDTISFTYTPFYQERKTISQNIQVDDKSTIVNPESEPDPVVFSEDPVSYESTSEDFYQCVRLTEIDFKQGKVLFDLINGSDKIDNIKIKDNSGNTTKTIQLNRSYLNDLSEIGYSTSKLDAIAFKDNTETSVETYFFQYYPMAVNPDPNQPNNTVLNVRYRDWWGYYNASGEHDMVPYYTGLEHQAEGAPVYYDFSVGNPSAARDPNLAGLESGILKKIIYPTGGSTEFVFECNKYFSATAQQVKNGPGLRISQIKTNDNNGVTSYRTFKYGDNENGYGVLDMEPDITTMSSESYFDYYPVNGGPHSSVTGAYRDRNFYSDFIPELSSIAARPVIYPTVTEYEGTLQNNIGKSVYTYDYSGWAASGMPSFETMTIQRKHNYNLNYCNATSLISKTDYKNISVGGLPSYQVKRKTVNLYNYTASETVTGLHVQKIHNLTQTGRVLGDYSPALFAEPFVETYSNPIINVYTYAPYQIPVGYKNLASTTETLYNDDGSTITNTTSYTYNSHQYVSKRSVSTSDAQTLNTQITYPFDYPAVPIYNQMSSINLNMLYYPIEQTQLKNTTPLSGVRTNYYNFGSTVPRIYPQTVDVKKGSGSYETRLHYFGYDDDGNPLSVSKENGVLNSYIWNYNKSYPVAEVKNANAADIAYTSFEADGNGNWTGIISGNTVADVNSVTGSKYYNLTSAGLTKTGLTTTTAYIVSYWSKGGQYSVTGTSAAGWPKNLRTVTINGVTWVNWEHNVSGVSAITISGTAGIDELRLYPANAQMTTYTYAPLIGMTSQTDSDNKVTYFEYDAFGRLKFIRDNNRNIIKTFSYQYNSTTY